MSTEAEQETTKAALLKRAEKQLTDIVAFRNEAVQRHTEMLTVTAAHIRVLEEIVRKLKGAQ